MKIILYFMVVLTLSQTAFNQTVAERQREFDFWIGEWDVNLRVRQSDSTWKDQHKSVARIYPILGGKAILELWSEGEKGINGYSLRYYNPGKGTWDLWLNWAGNNQSGTSGMECIFRHKRAECFSKRKINEATNLISRYSFSDVHPDSVRWDDAYSRDEGKTWSNNWIMEFTRRKKYAPAFDSEPHLHTYYNGNRCSAPQFEVLREMAEKHQNSSQLTIYPILDGCILAGFVKDKKANAFFTLTFNTYANAYEFAFLDDRDPTALELFYGPRTADGFSFQTAAVKDKKPSRASIIFTEKIESIELTYEGKSNKIEF